MNTLFKTTLSRIQLNGAVVLGAARSIGCSLGSAAAGMTVLLTEQRRAYAAALLHHRLSRMPDTELSKLGIRRADIARYVRERLYSS